MSLSRLCPNICTTLLTVCIRMNHRRSGMPGYPTVWSAQPRAAAKSQEACPGQRLRV